MEANNWMILIMVMGLIVLAIVVIRHYDNSIRGCKSMLDSARRCICMDPEGKPKCVECPYNPINIINLRPKFYRDQIEWEKGNKVKKCIYDNRINCIAPTLNCVDINCEFNKSTDVPR